MSHSIPDLSSLHCIRSEAAASHTKPLTNWIIEHPDSTQCTSQHHPHFNAQTGFYKTPKDGIYLLVVQLIPIGGPTLYNARQTRKNVHYALHLQHDVGDDEYLDIGTHNLGHMEHLRAGTNISFLRMAGAPGAMCVRIYICCVQRKTKKHHQVLSKKQIKRSKRQRNWNTNEHEHDDHGDEDDSSDSEWENGFDSDSTNDAAPTSVTIVGTLAKRLKTIPTN